MSNFAAKSSCKIVSKSGNPDAFCKMYLEIMEIVHKLGIWSNFVKNIWKCGLKLSKISGIPVHETTKKVWNSYLLYGGGEGTFYLEEPIVVRDFRYQQFNLTRVPVILVVVSLTTNNIGLITQGTYLQAVCRPPGIHYKVSTLCKYENNL